MQQFNQDDDLRGNDAHAEGGIAYAHAIPYSSPPLRPDEHDHVGPASGEDEDDGASHRERSSAEPNEAENEEDEDEDPYEPDVPHPDQTPELSEGSSPSKQQYWECVSSLISLSFLAVPLSIPSTFRFMQFSITNWTRLD